MNDVLEKEKPREAGFFLSWRATRSILRESVAITVRASAIGEYTENSIAAGECDD
ncbi:hypothetical protein [Burkholderia ambifaria]|uniref:hypothetical protein n=1 Tax=Burkholderia ambifaria TaxID=152480 RepID=UPI00158C5428|nr:hypothetical protein [Burkholderia ambifaria]